jgi:TFIIF-interacting CTD phosphatase-like protein
VGTFVKDLSGVYQHSITTLTLRSVIDSDLSQVLIVDNSPIAYSHNIGNNVASFIPYHMTENAVPISDFLGEDANDKALLDLLPFLDALRNVGLATLQF